MAARTANEELQQEAPERRRFSAGRHSPACDDLIAALLRSRVSLISLGGCSDCGKITGLRRCPIGRRMPTQQDRAS